MQKQCLGVSILYSNYRINTAFKVVFSSVLSWKYTLTPDLMGSNGIAGVFEIDCRLLIHKNKQHHKQNKSTGAAEKCSDCSESELVVTQPETETHSLLPAAQVPISLHLGIKEMPTQQCLSSVYPCRVL